MTHKGGETAQQDSGARMCENGAGNDERPAAPTADRSSHSDSPQRKGGMALMVATPRADRDPSPGILHVAHIEDYRINGNNHPDNLRTLCPECHAAEGGD